MEPIFAYVGLENVAAFVVLLHEEVLNTHTKKGIMQINVTTKEGIKSASLDFADGIAAGKLMCTSIVVRNCSVIEPVIVPKDLWQHRQIWPVQSKAMTEQVKPKNLQHIKRIMFASLTARIMCSVVADLELRVKDAMVLFHKANEMVGKGPEDFSSNAAWRESMVLRDLTKLACSSNEKSLAAAKEKAAADFAARKKAAKDLAVKQKAFAVLADFAAQEKAAAELAVHVRISSLDCLSRVFRNMPENWFSVMIAKILDR